MSRFWGNKSLGFLFLAKPVIAEGLETSEWFWNCASLSPKIFKMLHLLVFPPGTQECEKLQLPTLVLLKKLPAAGGAVRKYCRSQIVLTDLWLKVSGTEECFQRDGDGAGGGGAQLHSNLGPGAGLSRYTKHLTSSRQCCKYHA